MILLSVTNRDLPIM